MFRCVIARTLGLRFFGGTSIANSAGRTASSLAHTGLYPQSLQSLLQERCQASSDVGLKFIQWHEVQLLNLESSCDGRIAARLDSANLWLCQAGALP